MTRQRQSTAERRQQIALAALHIIATLGVHRMTTVELARAVGMADASLFRHFPNKEAIVSAAIDLFEGYLQQSLDAAALETEPLQRLHRFFVHRLELVRKYPQVLQLAFNDRLAEAAGPAEAERVSTIVHRSHAFLLEGLSRARTAGVVRTDLPAEVLIWAVAGVLRGAALAPGAVPMGPGGPVRMDPEAAWQALLGLLRPSLSAPPVAG
jgi:AcrR family transcriptional regulator